MAQNQFNTDSLNGKPFSLKELVQTHQFRTILIKKRHHYSYDKISKKTYEKVEVRILAKIGYPLVEYKDILISIDLSERYNDFESG